MMSRLSICCPSLPFAPVSCLCCFSSLSISFSISSVSILEPILFRICLLYTSMILSAHLTICLLHFLIGCISGNPQYTVRINHYLSLLLLFSSYVSPQTDTIPPVSYTHLCHPNTSYLLVILQTTYPRVSLK